MLYQLKVRLKQFETSSLQIGCKHTHLETNCPLSAYLGRYLIPGLNSAQVPPCTLPPTPAAASLFPSPTSILIQSIQHPPDYLRAQGEMELFSIGTGASIYTQQFIPAMLAAEHEILLVTCYWAPSKTLTAIRHALEQLARRRASTQHARHSPSAARPPPLRVRICFSSRSLLQKLFHTPSRRGRDYAPSTWESKLGLPSPELLAAGAIDLRVKSLFFLPFSVMHPKFLVVDRRRAFVPSCNVSWEPWLEACLELARGSYDSGEDPIHGLLEFYRGVWETGLDLDLDLSRWESEGMGEQEALAEGVASSTVRSPADTTATVSGIRVPSSAVEWLPSWHHRNPRFCLFPWQTPTAPDTPLNNALLRLFAAAARDVYIQTPNITSPPVMSAIMNALSRGVDVTIVTSLNMMVWEQLLTAGTTAERCIKDLTRRYGRLCKSAQVRAGHGPSSSQPGTDAASVYDLESQAPRPGALRISYFRALAGPAAGQGEEEEEEEPVQSHVKLTIFDGEQTVLGSGNMDRASWFTSQELGILVRSAAFATAVRGVVDKALEGRLDPFYPRTT